MQAWLDLQYIRARCDDLRAEAAALRLARVSTRATHGAARERIARTLLYVGELIVAAGERVRGDMTVAN